MGERGMIHDQTTFLFVGLADMFAHEEVQQ